MNNITLFSLMRWVTYSAVAAVDARFDRGSKTLSMRQCRLKHITLKGESEVTHADIGKDFDIARDLIWRARQEPRLTVRKGLRFAVIEPQTFAPPPHATPLL
jgi:hypothetical protein